MKDIGTESSLDVCMRLPTVDASFGEKRFGFGECNADGFVARWQLKGTGFGVAGFLDGVGELLGIFLRLETADDVDHEAFTKGEDFVVVVPDGHFEVETSELRR